MTAANGGRYDLLASPAQSEGVDSPAQQFEFRPTGKGKSRLAASATSTDTPSSVRSGTPASSNGTPVFFTGPGGDAGAGAGGGEPSPDAAERAAAAAAALAPAPARSAAAEAARDGAAGGSAQGGVEPSTPRADGKSTRRLSFLDIPDGSDAGSLRLVGVLDDSAASSSRMTATSGGSRRDSGDDSLSSRERHRRSRSLPPNRDRRATVAPERRSVAADLVAGLAGPPAKAMPGASSRGRPPPPESTPPPGATASGRSSTGGAMSTPVQSPTRTPASAGGTPAAQVSTVRKATLSASWYLSGELGLNLTSDRRHKPDNYKRERVYNTVFRLPYRLEQMLAYAVLLCFDSLLAMPTCLPLRTASLAYRLLRHNGMRLLSSLQRRRRRDSTTQRLEVLAHNVTDQLLVDALWVSVVVSTCWWISLQDVSALYHVIRGQEVVKMYVLFSVLQISDALLGSFGADMLEALACSAARVLMDARRLPALCALVLDFALLLAASLAHTACLLAQAITLMSAVNSRSNALLALLISANFSEVKGYVFKRMDATKIGQLACQDAVERVHMFLCLGFVISQHLQHTHSGRSSWPVLLEAVIIFLCEVAVDVLKHAFMAKFNDIRPDTYKDVLRDLARRTLRVHSHQAHLVLGFVPIAPLALAIRAAPPILTVVFGMKRTALQIGFMYVLLWVVKIPTGVIVHRLAQSILGEKNDWSAATRIGGPHGSGGVTPKFYGAVREQPPRHDHAAGAAVAAAAAVVPSSSAAGGGGLSSPSAAGQAGLIGQKLAFYGSLPSPKRPAGDGGVGGKQHGEQQPEVRRRSIAQSSGWVTPPPSAGTAAAAVSNGDVTGGPQAVGENGAGGLAAASASSGHRVADSNGGQKHKKTA